MEKLMQAVNPSESHYYPQRNIDPDLILISLLYLDHFLWDETTDTEHGVE